MIKYIVLLVYLTSTVQAGIKSVDNINSISKTNNTILVYKKDNSVDLEQLLEAKQGCNVVFKISNDETITGVVTGVTGTAHEGIRVVGVFNEQTKSGFLFYFKLQETKSVVSGALIFTEKAQIFQLKYNENTKQFYFEKQDIKVKADASHNTLIKK